MSTLVKAQHTERVRLAFRFGLQTLAVECPVCGQGEGRDCVWNRAQRRGEGSR